jgi:NADPH:quinone reductase-like Zn-dependent oxidoreductase
MRAITQGKYGLDSRVLSDMPTPKIGSKQILVKVEAAWGRYWGCKSVKP